MISNGLEVHNRKGQNENQIAKLVKEVRTVCSPNLNGTTYVSYPSCFMSIHSTCCQSAGSTSEEINAVYHCDICKTQEKIQEERQKVQKVGQKRGDINLENCNRFNL